MNILYDKELNINCGRTCSLETQIATEILKRYRESKGLVNNNGQAFVVGVSEELATRPLLNLYEIIKDEDYRKVIKYFRDLLDSDNPLTISWRNWVIGGGSMEDIPLLDISIEIDRYTIYLQQLSKTKTQFESFIKEHSNEKKISYKGTMTQSYIPGFLERESPNTEFLLVRHNPCCWRIYNLWRQEWRGDGWAGNCGKDLCFEINKDLNTEISSASVCKGKIFIEFTDEKEANKILEVL